MKGSSRSTIKQSHPLSWSHWLFHTVFISQWCECTTFNKMLWECNRRWGGELRNDPGLRVLTDTLEFQFIILHLSFQRSWTLWRSGWERSSARCPTSEYRRRGSQSPRRGAGVIKTPSECSLSLRQIVNVKSCSIVLLRNLFQQPTPERDHFSLKSCWISVLQSSASLGFEPLQWVFFLENQDAHYSS